MAFPPRKPALNILKVQPPSRTNIRLYLTSNLNSQSESSGSSPIPLLLGSNEHGLKLPRKRASIPRQEKRAHRPLPTNNPLRNPQKCCVAIPFLTRKAKKFLRSSTRVLKSFLYNSISSSGNLPSHL